MKIRTEADREALEAKIKTELGIDVRKYKNEEVAENFLDLLLLPQYLIKWGIWPVFIVIGLFFLGFFFIDLEHVENLIYLFAGFPLAIVIGLLSGLLFLTWKFKSDLFGIIEYSLGIMRSCGEDLDLVSDQVTPENRSDVMGLLFNGVIHVVTIPVLTEVMSDKAPLIGHIVKGPIVKILTLISDRLSFDEEMLNTELQKGQDEPGFIENYSVLITQATTGMNTILSVAVRVVQFPLKAGFVVAFLLMSLLIYLLW